VGGGENVLRHKEILYKEKADAPSQALLVARSPSDTLSPDDTDRQFLLFSDPSTPPIPHPPLRSVAQSEALAHARGINDKNNILTNQNQIIKNPFKKQSQGQPFDSLV
jgi:hypothetical protein